MTPSTRRQFRSGFLTGDTNYSWKTVFKSTRILIYMMLGEELRQARMAAGMTQENLAFHARISRNYVSLLELNAKSPTIDVLDRICGALGVRTSVLIARRERRRR